jgi:hypothetical protein
VVQHFNIQIVIQRVTTEPVKAGQARGINQAVSGKDRESVEILRVAVVGDTEAEAYAKAAKMLEASKPPVADHLHRASCDDASGNQICGFPADGPSIADPR